MPAHGAHVMAAQGRPAPVLAQRHPPPSLSSSLEMMAHARASAVSQVSVSRRAPVAPLSASAPRGYAGQRRRRPVRVCARFAPRRRDESGVEDSEAPLILPGGRTARRLDPMSERMGDELVAVTELTSACFQDLNGPPIMDKVRGWLYRWKTFNLLKTFVTDSSRFFLLVVEDPQHPGPEGSGRVSDFAEEKLVAEDGVVDGIVASCDCTLLYPGAQIQQGLKLWNPRFSMQHMVYVSSMAVSPSCRRQGVATSLLEAVEEEAVRHFRNNRPSWLALYVYDENPGAKDLYFKAGFEVAREDSRFAPLWTLQPRRLLLVKEVPKAMEYGDQTWMNYGGGSGLPVDGGDEIFGGAGGSEATLVGADV